MFKLETEMECVDTRLGIWSNLKGPGTNALEYRASGRLFLPLLDLRFEATSMIAGRDIGDP